MSFEVSDGSVECFAAKLKDDWSSAATAEAVPSVVELAAAGVMS